MRTEKCSSWNWKEKQKNVEIWFFSRNNWCFSNIHNNQQHSKNFEFNGHCKIRFSTLFGRLLCFGGAGAIFVEYLVLLFLFSFSSCSSSLCVFFFCSRSLSLRYEIVSACLCVLKIMWGHGICLISGQFIECACAPFNFNTQISHIHIHNQCPNYIMLIYTDIVRLICTLWNTNAAENADSF